MMDVKKVLSYAGIIILTVIATLFFSNTNNSKQINMSAETQTSLHETIKLLEASIVSLNQSIDKIHDAQNTAIPQYKVQDSGVKMQSEESDKAEPLTLNNLAQVMEEVVESKLQEARLNTNFKETMKEQEPTTEQVNTFEQMQREIADPMYNSKMTFSSLVQSMDEKELPKSMRRQLLSQAVQMLNNGELDPATFMGR